MTWMPAKGKVAAPPRARNAPARISQMKSTQSDIELSTRKQDALHPLADGLTKGEIATEPDPIFHSVDNHLRRPSLFASRCLHVSGVAAESVSKIKRWQAQRYSKGRW